MFDIKRTPIIPEDNEDLVAFKKRLVEVYDVTYAVWASRWLDKLKAQFPNKLALNEAKPTVSEPTLSNGSLKIKATSSAAGRADDANAAVLKSEKAEDIAKVPEQTSVPDTDPFFAELLRSKDREEAVLLLKSKTNFSTLETYAKLLNIKQLEGLMKNGRLITTLQASERDFISNRLASLKRDSALESSALLQDE